MNPGITRAVLMAYGHRCQYCGGVADSVDHIVANFWNTDDHPSNLTAACRRCNSKKGEKRLSPEIEARVKAAALTHAIEVEKMANRYRAGIADAFKIRAAFKRATPWPPGQTKATTPRCKHQTSF